MGGGGGGGVTPQIEIGLTLPIPNYVRNPSLTQNWNPFNHLPDRILISLHHLPKLKYAGPSPPSSTQLKYLNRLQAYDPFIYFFQEQPLLKLQFNHLTPTRTWWGCWWVQHKMSIPVVPWLLASSSWSLMLIPCCNANCRRTLMISFLICLANLDLRSVMTHTQIYHLPLTLISQFNIPYST